MLIRYFIINIAKLYQLWSFSNLNHKHCSFAYPDNCSTRFINDVQNLTTVSFSAILNSLKTQVVRHKILHEGESWCES